MQTVGTVLETVGVNHLLVHVHERADTLLDVARVAIHEHAFVFGTPQQFVDQHAAIVGQRQFALLNELQQVFHRVTTTDHPGTLQEVLHAGATADTFGHGCCLPGQGFATGDDSVVPQHGNDRGLFFTLDIRHREVRIGCRHSIGHDLGDSSSRFGQWPLFFRRQDRLGLFYHRFEVGEVVDSFAIDHVYRDRWGLDSLLGSQHHWFNRLNELLQQLFGLRLDHLEETDDTAHFLLGIGEVVTVLHVLSSQQVEPLSHWDVITQGRFQFGHQITETRITLGDDNRIAVGLVQGDVVVIDNTADDFDGVDHLGTSFKRLRTIS
ncbi:hypothetical protein D3C87_1194170 [compost metagenome]